MRYIPILKYKERIDLSAYGKLDKGIGDSIVPLIEVFQQDKITLEKIEQEKMFFLNLGYELDFKECVDTFETIYQTHKNVIPVINSNHYFNSLSKKELIGAFKRLMSIGFKEYAVKINNIHNFYIQDQLETILIMLDNIENVTFFLDVDYAYKILKKDMMKNIFLNTIDRLKSTIGEDIKKIVMCGSIVPMQSINFSSYEDDDESAGGNVIENILFKSFLELKDVHKNLDLYYGDYTIDEKNALLDDNAFVTSFYPVVKYTIDDGDVIVFKSKGKKDFLKYPEMANKIIKTIEYAGEDHCIGCKYLNSIAKGEGSGNSTGSPSTWKTNMITHHITVMASLLK